MLEMAGGGPGLLQTSLTLTLLRSSGAVLVTKTLVAFPSPRFSIFAKQDLTQNPSLMLVAPSGNGA